MLGIFLFASNGDGAADSAALSARKIPSNLVVSRYKLFVESLHMYTSIHEKAEGVCVASVIRNVGRMDCE